VDSGPIIRLTGMSSLWKRAEKFYTVPAVLQEIRDAKARQHLESLPFELVAKEASQESVQVVIDFAKKTGDYQSLSSVDLQVLGLLYDLEREGCSGDMSHVRKKPKRTVGIGKMEMLSKSQESISEPSSRDHTGKSEDIVTTAKKLATVATTTALVDNIKEKEDDDETSGEQGAESSSKPKTWATLVNQKLASTELPRVCDGNEIQQGGQFSDAEEEENDAEEQISDKFSEKMNLNTPVNHNNSRCSKDEELKSEFPSLAASLLVPYEGSDNDDGDHDDNRDDVVDNKTNHLKEEERKRQALLPISKSGRTYNSFRKYGHLMKPKRKVERNSCQDPVESNIQVTAPKNSPESENNSKLQSRIMAGMSVAGQEIDVEDDGEGWISCTNDIQSMKSTGAVSLNKAGEENGQLPKQQGPPTSQRAACATTDFAMQNVILQMNLELLSVDGYKIRKLKSWVTRCGACFRVYTASGDSNVPGGSKRLFFEHCGSDMMQRIAASVDSKTGRLRLHLSKKYKHNLRGTKFSLPKPGTGNRFQGDLLLREDQLLTGAWNQKAKMMSGGKARAAAQSIFGNDLASSMGCNVAVMTSDDIRVGFGRRNPNAAKGRERRGKKKKTPDRACGLRRY